MNIRELEDLGFDDEAEELRLADGLRQSDLARLRREREAERERERRRYVIRRAKRGCGCRRPLPPYPILP